jgi:hypothetical protein
MVTLKRSCYLRPLYWLAAICHTFTLKSIFGIRGWEKRSQVQYRIQEIGTRFKVQRLVKYTVCNVLDGSTGLMKLKKWGMIQEREGK